MSRRVIQVQDLIQKELGKILARDVEFEPGIFPNILRVDVSPDLKNATVYMGVVPPTARKDVIKTINKQIGDIQGTLNKLLYMKFVPRLTFKIDTTIDNVDKVNQLLKKIHTEDNNGEE